MSDSTCISCRRPKATMTCGLCEGGLCKDCENYLDESTFSFLKKIPEELSHTHYCSSCHANTVEPKLEEYQANMEAARGVFVFFHTQKHPVALTRKSKTPVEVKECDDRDETILRLAFLAVLEGFNAIVETKVEAKKVRDPSGYQRAHWSGIAMPAQVDPEKIERYQSKSL